MPTRHSPQWAHSGLGILRCQPIATFGIRGEDGVVRFWDGELNALFQISITSPIRGICFTAMARMVVATHNGLVMIALDEQMLVASADRNPKGN